MAARQRRIRQLEHCNPAVFGDVCLTPYQDLNDLYNVRFVSLKMATSLTSAKSPQPKKKKRRQFGWIDGHAVLFKSASDRPRVNHNNQHYQQVEKSTENYKNLTNEGEIDATLKNSCYDCDECENINYLTIGENGDGACSYSEGDADEYTNDTYYNLDFTMLERRRCSILVDQLLLEIYSTYQAGITDYNSGTSCKSAKYVWMDRHQLNFKEMDELTLVLDVLQKEVVRTGNLLVRRLKRRDALSRQREARCEVITCLLKKVLESLKERVPEFSPEMRFSLQPLPGDSGFAQWHSAMKMVSQLPEGIPPEFRRRLWLSLADKHLHAKRVDWPAAERDCFSEWSHPADAELGVQIVKDLHRTGCSLFCGKDGKENQALLKRVLLAYARWNKNVGYCQGFNMLAALMLQVTEKSEADALKLMIYLIEGVLPDSYFADSLRGLSVDMAVFRELLRTKLPKLSKHLDTLQVASKEGTTSYEPPLTNVFTMQWFLTLFCNCLPQPTVLRVWDLILLEGNEILLRTSLAIWQVLADRIMTAKTADEFYCVMGMLMREILEFDLIDANTLVKGIVSIGPLTELSALREHYLYNINPWGAVPTNNRDAPSDAARRNKTAHHRDKLVLDIGVLKKQYTKLKQRQRQAHVIFNTAVARQTARPAPVAMNHLLLGKSALVAKRGTRPGPPKGAVPPPRHLANNKPRPQATKAVKEAPPPPRTLHWKDEEARRRSSPSSSSSSDTELCDEPGDYNSDDDRLEDRKCQLPDLPDDNLEAAPPDKPDSTLKSDNSDIDVSPTSKTDESLIPCAITSLVNETSASAPPPCVVPDLLDFVEPPGDAPPATLSFNIDEFLGDAETSLATSDTYASTDGATDDYFLTLNEKLQRSDSLPSEDGFDFEKFLEERVKCLKDIKDFKDNKEKPYSSEESLEDTSETERMKYARKNSVRALEIIQENSLILHRILQCQSRLTPTPPPYEDLELDNDREDALEVMSTPTPTNENQRLSLVDGNAKEEELIEIEVKTPEKLNAFRPFGDFSEFLSKYQTKTPETERANAHFIDLTSNFTDSNLNDEREDEVGDNFKYKVKEIDLGGDAAEANTLEAVTLEGCGTEIEVRQDVAPKEDDAAYLNRLISKYNFISKQHEESNSPGSKMGATKDAQDKKDEESVKGGGNVKVAVNEIDVDGNAGKEKEIASMSTQSTTFASATYRPIASANIVEVDYNLEKYRHKLGSPLAEIDNEAGPETETDKAEGDLIEIDKNSKYNSILEYSRNLDEKFNNLILKSPKLSKLHSDRLKTNLKSNYSLDLPDRTLDGVMSHANGEGDGRHVADDSELTPKSSHSFQDFGAITADRFDFEKLDDSSTSPSHFNRLTSPKMASSSKSFIVTTEVDQQEDVATSCSSSKNTMDVDVLIESPSLKSPNRIYNPFPVSISSRQSKEVPFRLGLYKK